MMATKERNYENGAELVSVVGFKCLLCGAIYQGDNESVQEMAKRSPLEPVVTEVQFSVNGIIPNGVDMQNACNRINKGGPVRLAIDGKEMVEYRNCLAVITDEDRREVLISNEDHVKRKYNE